MGRLNYTNRKIEGVRLGQVVAKDLTKRIPPALGSKAALRDPVVEIDLRSKRLTDAGFLELSEGLAKSVHYDGPQGKVVLLEELCLKANRLTVTSLQRLAPIIKLIAHNLRDLDLSDNMISINDPDDVIPWETFLKSLSSCCVLRRLDLSGNELGTKAFEVLARVYAREEPVDLVLQEGFECLSKNSVADCAAALEHVKMSQPMAIVSESEDVDRTEEQKSRTKSRKEKVSRHGSKSLEKGSSSPEKHNHIARREEQLELYATTKGLHSIPYIVLSDSSMSDAAALYLSYIIAVHHGPEQLLTRVPPAKAGPEQQQLDAYDETQCQGIIYLPKSKITKNGMKVLDLAEKERRKLTEPISSHGSYENFCALKAVETIEHGRGCSLLRGYLTAGTHRRRASGSASGYLGSLGSPAKSMSDLDRARSRIQGEELERTERYGNDLWRRSINMLCLCREIQLPPRKEPAQAAQHHFQADMDFSLATEFPPLQTLIPPKLNKSIIKSLEVPGFPSKKAKSPASLLPLRNCNPNQTILPRSYHSRKASMPGVPDVPTVIPPTPLPISPSTKLAIAVARANSRVYRSKLPCGFSDEVWWRILGQAAGAQGILSEMQQRSVLTWAMDRNTLRREREWLGEKEGNQIWHVLDGMGCLAYEIEV